MNCTFEEHGLPDERGWRTVRCTRCGIVLAPTPHEVQYIHCECPILGVGDYMAKGLAAFGITKERVAWVGKQFGLSGCFGCDQRQESMNEAGKKIGL